MASYRANLYCVRYFVLDSQGARYGPADLTLLNQWAAQGRVMPGTVLVEEISGRQIRAADLPGLALLPMPGTPQGPTYGAPLPGSFQNPGFSPGGPFSQVPQGMGGPFGNVSNGSKDVNASLGLSAATAVLCACIPVLPILTGVGAILAARSATQKGHPGANTAMLLAILSTGCALVVTLALGSLFQGIL